MRLVPKGWPHLRSAAAGAVILTVIFAAQDWREHGAREGVITGLWVAVACLAVIGLVWLIDRRRHTT